MKRALWSVGFGLFALCGMVGAASADGNVEAGKAAAASCSGCHGAEGQGASAAPRLAGMKKDRFEQAIKEYKSGKRANSMMKSIAQPLGKDDIENLAAYYASLKAK